MPEYANDVMLGVLGASVGLGGKDKALPQKFWVSYFAEYIVDRVYPQPDLKKGAR